MRFETDKKRSRIILTDDPATKLIIVDDASLGKEERHGLKARSSIT
jgi:hypothetical protein